MFDYDVGEMFLESMMEPKLRPYAGMNLICLFTENVSTETPFIKGWRERTMMGVSHFPYLNTKDLMEVKQIIKGDRKFSGNIFGLKKVLLNFPGSNLSDPSMFWVYKVRWYSKVAADLFFYIDDGRPTIYLAKDSWKSTQ